MAGVALAHRLPITLDNGWLGLQSAQAHCLLTSGIPLSLRLAVHLVIHDDVSTGVILIARKK